MLEAKKCVRCGCMYISDSEVCSKCQAKDGVDIYKLKGFFAENSYEKFTKNELSQITGIAGKNLSRFLNYDEFKGLCKRETVAASSNKINDIENNIELV